MLLVVHVNLESEHRHSALPLSMPPLVPVSPLGSNTGEFLSGDTGVGATGEGVCIGLPWHKSCAPILGPWLRWSLERAHTVVSQLSSLRTVRRCYNSQDLKCDEDRVS